MRDCSKRHSAAPALELGDALFKRKTAMVDKNVAFSDDLLVRRAFTAKTVKEAFKVWAVVFWNLIR